MKAKQSISKRTLSFEFGIILILMFCLIYWSCSTAPVQHGEGAAAPSPIAEGDLATIVYTLALEDGTLVATNRASDLSRPRSDFFRASEPILPEDLLVGKSNRPTGLHKTLVGMRAGERRRVELSPEEAYGNVDRSKRQFFPRRQSVPKRTKMPTEIYKSNFRKQPVEGNTVRLMPHFPHRVTSVKGGQVFIEAMAQDGDVYSDGMGSTRITVRENDVLLDLEPAMGANISFRGERGRIIDVQKQHFAVDFNHPLAGRLLVLDVEVREVYRAEDLEGIELDWFTDPFAGQEKAFVENLPQVVVLHRQGCYWCERLFEETLTDPRVKYLHDRFVWCQVDTGNDPDLKERFQQDGTPNVLILNPGGDVIDRRDSYLDPAALNRMLRLALEKQNAERQGAGQGLSGE